MTKPLPFADEEFDLTFIPASNCYIEQAEPLWKECARVLKKGGRLLAGFDNGFNFLFGEGETKTACAICCPLTRLTIRSTIGIPSETTGASSFPIP